MAHAMALQTALPKVMRAAITKALAHRAPTGMWVAIAMPIALRVTAQLSIVHKAIVHKAIVRKGIAKATDSVAAMHAATKGHARAAQAHPATVRVAIAHPATIISHAENLKTMTTNRAPMRIWAHKAVSMRLVTKRMVAAALANPIRHAPAWI